MMDCPGCGAPIDRKNPGMVMAVCEHCGNIVYWDEDAVRSAGKRALLPEGFTRLYTGATGELFHKRFVVHGRIRYGFDRGFWDEWFLELDDGKTGWLTEDDHQLALERPTNNAVVPPISQLAPASRFSLGGRVFVVEEVGTARCLGAEGVLPKPVDPGESYRYADASSPDGEYSLGIEYDEDPPTVFLGQWLKWSAVKLDDEGESW